MAPVPGAGAPARLPGLRRQPRGDARHARPVAREARLSPRATRSRRAHRHGAGARSRPAPRRAPGNTLDGPLAGGGLVGALAGVVLMLLIGAPGGGGGNAALLGSLVDNHVRSLMADHLTDVLTSDQHTVKPWLSQHIDVSPPVKELAAQGFPLVGGRLDYIDGHPAAVVVYRRAKHVINLFAWATSAPDAPMRAASRQGFNVITWRAGGIAYAAVSDVEADQLQEFARDVAAGG